MGRKKQQAEPKLGHNGGPLMNEQKSRLKGYVAEIERMEVQKREIEADIKMIYASAKDAEFDTKAIRHVVRVRRADKRKQEALEHAVDVYKHALGMLSDLPLGIAALAEQGRKLADDMGLPPLPAEGERVRGGADA
jgi:uncharacterized protein (UPF0335 family)